MKWSFQRTRVRMQSSATFIEQIFIFIVSRRDEKREKESGNGPYFVKKKYIELSLFIAKKSFKEMTEPRIRIASAR